VPISTWSGCWRRRPAWASLPCPRQHLIADGLSNQAIATRLVVAVSTVKKHANNIFGKLDVQSRTQALLRARELNLL
jgi:DNA-binding CsgD family transcriptional regulator